MLEIIAFCCGALVMVLEILGRLEMDIRKQNELGRLQVVLNHLVAIMLCWEIRHGTGMKMKELIA